MRNQPHYYRQGPADAHPYLRCRNVRGRPEHDLVAYGPRPVDARNVTCPACGRAFVAGDHTTLLALGPGADEIDRAVARSGGYYTARAVEVHLACVTGHDPVPADAPPDEGAVVLVASEPRPTDPVCPVCGEIVRRSNPKLIDSSTICPNFHDASSRPIPYQQFLAELGAVGGTDS